jgi:hypothetical protein
MRLCIQPHGTGQTDATMKVTGQVSCWRSEGLSTTPAGVKAEASSARLSTVFVVGKHGRRRWGWGRRVTEPAKASQKHFVFCAPCETVCAPASTPFPPNPTLAYACTMRTCSGRSSPPGCRHPVGAARRQKRRQAPRRNCSALGAFSIAHERSAKERGVAELLRFKSALMCLCAGATQQQQSWPLPP